MTPLNNKDEIVNLQPEVRVTTTNNIGWIPVTQEPVKRRAKLEVPYCSTSWTIALLVHKFQAFGITRGVGFGGNSDLVQMAPSQALFAFRVTEDCGPDHLERLKLHQDRDVPQCVWYMYASRRPKTFNAGPRTGT
ncbi:hypothetical protein K443DRAFT_123320 [Laccaria amethystina LaAM-08-1]|uniref:Uncharacterized protein n=1 Tax=Laccaria amethystina LaAM-08-1 TaxID=1095629 RepID=A0A0C9XCG5_9AGAR|nr:hypothetical protein K443DRAFT_123320 [Laccaria amethystina LaAM-08-1]